VKQQMIDKTVEQRNSHTAQPMDWAEIETLVLMERLNPAQRKRLRAILDQNPALVRVLPGIGQQLRERIISALVRHEGTAAVMLKQTEEMAVELGYGQSSALERLLIDVVVTTWLGWQAAEWRFQDNTAQHASTAAQIDAWERRLSMAQNRYLRACEALARVRRLLVRTPVQINIAAQQIVSNQGDGR
jgi:hypothetical protein